MDQELKPLETSVLAATAEAVAPQRLTRLRRPEDVDVTSGRAGRGAVGSGLRGKLASTKVAFVKHRISANLRFSNAINLPSPLPRRPALKRLGLRGYQ